MRAETSYVIKLYLYLQPPTAAQSAVIAFSKVQAVGSHPCDIAGTYDQNWRSAYAANLPEQQGSVRQTTGFQIPDPGWHSVYMCSVPDVCM